MVEWTQAEKDTDRFRLDGLYHNRPQSIGGPYQGEINQINVKIGQMQATLAAILAQHFAAATGTTDPEQLRTAAEAAYDESLAAWVQECAEAAAAAEQVLAAIVEAEDAARAAEES